MLISPVLSSGRAAVLLGALFGMSGVGSSAVAVVLPQLAAGLGTSSSTATWAISAFTVALAVATPLHGRLSDMVGIRLPLTLGVLAMALGAAVAACAPSLAVLLPARVLQGAGGSAIAVLAAALVTARYTGRERRTALGLIAGMSAVVSSLGPVAGGVLEALGGWRLAVALPAVALLGVVPVWRMAPARGTGEPIDLPGAALVAATASGIVLLIQSPSTGPVVALVGATLLAGSVVPLAAWVRTHPEGFLPRAVITNGTVLRSALAAAVIPMTWFGLMVTLPFVTASWGWSALGTGLLVVPSSLVGLVSPWLARYLLGRVGPHWSLAVAAPLALGALVLGLLGTVLGSPALWVSAMLAITVGFGLGQPALMAAVGSAVEPGRQGGAVGVATLLFFVGGGVGAASVGGLAEVIGIPATFAVLALLPAAALVTAVVGARAARAVPRPGPAEQAA